MSSDISSPQNAAACRSTNSGSAWADILKHEHKGTLYCLKLLPFGGACVMEGEDGESENEHAFGKAKLPRRMLIVCAGALMNFLVGFLIVLAVMQPNGPNGGYIVSTIASVDPASTAAGNLQAGDEILKIDGYHILVRSDFETALSRTASTTHEVTVRREGEKVTLPSVKLEATVTDANGNKRIGITFAELPDSLGMHLSMSVRTAVNYARSSGRAWACSSADRSAWISWPVRSAWPRSWRIPPSTA